MYISGEGGGEYAGGVDVNGMEDEERRLKTRVYNLRLRLLLYFMAGMAHDCADDCFPVILVKLVARSLKR